MDLGTVMLLLAVGSFVFGLLLVVLKFSGQGQQEVPFWVFAKFSQAAGSLLLYFRVDRYDALSVLVNATLVLGCAYEAWTVAILSDREVKRELRLGTAVSIVLVVVASSLLPPPYRTGIVFLLQSVCYLLPSVFLLGTRSTRTPLRTILGTSYLASSAVFLVTAAACLAFPSYAMSEPAGALFAVVPVTRFCIFLVSGIILVMLVKERSDLLVAQMQKSLQESQSQFQRVVETAIEGILMFDEDFTITFANEKMASVLGYAPEELLGKPYKSLFAEGFRHVADYQESRRRQGLDSVYEGCLVGKDGRERWFLVSAKAIKDESGRFEGSFAMLSDITERKAMEMALEESNRLLTELSNTDSLTGIANRRSFDKALEREYTRLERTDSTLSVILLDLDHFKAYNDRYGHVMGDSCLRKVAVALADCVGRSVDLAARYGGEEFGCILPDTDLRGGLHVAKRIKKRIEELKIEHADSPTAPYVTASFGVITVHYSPQLCLEEIVHMADGLLYKAKAGGRNRIEFAEWKDSGQQAL